MGNQFKEGDTVVCVNTNDMLKGWDSRLTMGKSYRVVESDPFDSDRSVRVVTDRGDECSFFAWRFQLVDHPTPNTDVTISLDEARWIVGYLSIELLGDLSEEAEADLKRYRDSIAVAANKATK